MSSAQKFKDLAERKALSPEDIGKLNKEWCHDVNELMDKICGWLTDEDINHKARTREYKDPIIGSYEAKSVHLTMGGLEDVRVRPNQILSSFPNIEIVILGAHSVRIKRCKDRKWIIDDSISNLTKDNFFDALTYACGLEG